MTREIYWIFAPFPDYFHEKVIELDLMFWVVIEVDLIF